MRDLFKVISWLKAETAMEYCELFDGIKSILEFSNKNIKSFDKLYFKPGNENIMKDIINRLENLFWEHEASKDDETMQKVVIFLAVNSNISFKRNLKDNPYLGHVVEVCPLMPTFLLMDIIWTLKLDKYFYEMLTYTPCWFSYQFFEPATESLKYVLNPFDVLGKVENLLKAIIFSIGNTQHGEIDIINIKILTNKLCDSSMNLMRQFYTPDAEKFERFTKTQHYKYDGYALRHLLHLILHAFDVYEQNMSFTLPELPEKLKIFAIFQKFSKVLQESSTTTSKVVETLKKQQLKIIIAILNALQNNIMLVNVDKYLYWAEIEEKNAGTRNLQEEIGNLIYKVTERIKQNSNFNHDVINQLGALAIRPLSLEEVIENATIGDILNAIDESQSTPLEVKKLWLNELINRKMALGNEECLQAIKQIISLISSEHCIKIMNFIKLEIERYYLEANEMEYNPEMLVDLEEAGISQDLISVLLKSLQYLNELEIITIIQKQIDLFGDKVNICMQPQLEQRIVEFLNQSNGNEKEFNYMHFLTLTIENPQLCWTKFYRSACTNQKHIVLYCTVVKRFILISEKYFSSLLKESLAKKDDIQQLCFPRLLSEIYFQLYADGKKTDFLKGIIHTHVNLYLDLNDYQLLLPIMKAMNIMVCHGESQSYKLLNFGELTAPVLLMVAQIMDKARWDLITYSHIRDELIRECIQFVQQTSKRFLPNATAKDRKWISSVVTDTCKPLTQFYFQKYSLTLGQEPLKFHRFLMREDTEDESKIQTFLIANYLRCTSKEAEWLANCEKLLPHIYDSLCILRALVNSSNNRNAIDNYQHCLIMYINIAQKYLLPNIADSNEEIIGLEIKLLKLIASSNEEIYESTFEIFEPMLFNILRMYKGPMDIKVVQKLQQILNKIADCGIKTVFVEKMEGLLNIVEPNENTF